ncbi:MAG: hypothetical protein AAFU51_10340 [Bacteroidota bacterium]
MANPNPDAARARRGKAAKRRQRAEDSGTLDDLRTVLWSAIERVEKLTESEDAAQVLKATHALVQASGTYVKVVEAAELEARLDAVEKALAEGKASASFQQPRAAA